jgi:hypothetical protein
VFQSEATQTVATFKHGLNEALRGKSAVDSRREITNRS